MDLCSAAEVLVVGAGGIGCELLKDLVLTGFSKISIIDLDTIEVSNLNRQLLFQRQHVGRPKVEVARQSALLYNPSAVITTYHDNIQSPQYDTDFFKQFSLVMNALDNKAARNHVNRMCLAADVTLVESGSAGYLGQVTVIKKGRTECYECQPKPSTKTFPGCTIRNTPSEPVHCVVWAKYLFSQLFGEPDAENDVSPEVDGETAKSTRAWVQGIHYDPALLLNKLFSTDISCLLRMEQLWTHRKPPTPLIVENLCTANSSEELSSQDNILPDQKIWSLRECVEVFIESLKVLRKQQLSVGDLTWDKDDGAAMDFVAAASNLRAHVFEIPRKSRFDIKSIAGSIIPAVATTNAIIAGLIVMEALKILAGDTSLCKSTYLPKYPNPRKQLFISCPLAPPNPKCYVCAPRPEVTLVTNVKILSVLNFQEKILKEHLGMVAPDVDIDDGKGTILISSEEGETTENLPKALIDLGVTSGTRLKADDFMQSYELMITILHRELPDDTLFTIQEASSASSESKKRKATDNSETEGPVSSRRRKDSSEL